jgi:hypothetical protein
MDTSLPEQPPSQAPAKRGINKGILVAGGLALGGLATIFICVTAVIVWGVNQGAADKAGMLAVTDQFMRAGKDNDPDTALTYFAPAGLDTPIPSREKIVQLFSNRNLFDTYQKVVYAGKFHITTSSGSIDGHIHYDSGPVGFFSAKYAKDGNGWLLVDITIQRSAP